MSSSSSRIENLIRGLELQEVDLLLVSCPVNIRYLTGFTGTNALCLLGREKRLFITDFRYREQARTQVEELDTVIGDRELYESIPGIIGGESGLRLGIDHKQLSVGRYEGLRDLLPADVEIVFAGGIIEELRAVKDRSELKAIRQAAKLADAVFTSVLEGGMVGRSEREIAWQIERGLREAGAGSVAFAPIVAAGPNGALPHAQAGDYKIGPGLLVVIDWGCELGGYASDCTRTVSTGAIDHEAGSVYSTVLEAQRSALELVSAGVKASDVDQRARSVIEEAGYGQMFGHGTGHGVGLSVHEAPRISQRSDYVLKAGNVITIEPGIYLQGKLGVRIEDLVVVQERGCEVLTGIDKELQIVS